MKLQFDFIRDTKQGIIELNVFTRLLEGEIYDFEEIRKDSPLDYTDGYEYVGLAPSGSSIADPVWSCIRFTWENSRKTRMQYKADMTWNNRTQGWPQ